MICLIIINPKKEYDEYFSSEDSLPRSSLEPLLSSLGEIGLDQLKISHGIARKLLLRHGTTFRLNDSGNRGSERIIPFDPLPRVIGSSEWSDWIFLYQLIELIKDRVKYTPRHMGPAWTEVFITGFGWRSFDPSVS